MWFVMKMSSIVTLAEHGIGFCILCNKICVKLSGKHRNKNLTNKQQMQEFQKSFRLIAKS